MVPCAIPLINAGYTDVASFDFQLAYGRIDGYLTNICLHRMSSKEGPTLIDSDILEVIQFRGRLSFGTGALTIGKHRNLNRSSFALSLSHCQCRTVARETRAGVRTDDKYDLGLHVYSFGHRCDETGVRPSMDSVGDCHLQRDVRELLCDARRRISRPHASEKNRELIYTDAAKLLLVLSPICFDSLARRTISLVHAYFIRIVSRSMLCCLDVSTRG